MSADSMHMDYNPDNALFFKDKATGQDVMRLTMEGTQGIRVAPKDSYQMYGAVEVMAMTDGTCGAVSAFYVSAHPLHKWSPKGCNGFNRQPGLPFGVDFECSA